MLKRRSSARAKGRSLLRAAAAAGPALDRRSFLKRSGLAAGGLAAAAASLGGLRQARAQTPAAADQVREVRTVCTHCSVGCTVVAEVLNGAWVGQEAGVDSPISMGGHCAKGAAVRHHALGNRRLKYPLKLTAGGWSRIGWEGAIAEIGRDLLRIRGESGPDAVYWLGSANHSNEQAYLLRKFAAFWGTNNIDHDARLFSAAADTALAMTWGFGAMSNSFNDLQNARSILVIGGSPAEDQPVSMLHLLRARERNNAPLIVCDPRFSRTAALADEYVRYRPGTDVALVWGLLREILANGWEDKDYLRRRVWGFDGLKDEIEKWTADEVERVTGVPGDVLRRVARALGSNRPGAAVWSAPGTQNVLAANNARAFAILQLALGNVGVAGAGANGFRLQDNAQGASDMGVLCDSLPGYYGLSTRAWQHWARVWGVPYDNLVARFDGEKARMERPGIAGSRWFDGVLADPETLDQPGNVRALVLWGQAAHLNGRLPEMKRALDRLELVIAIGAYPNMAAVMGDREDGIYLLPSTTQFETHGSVTASNRSVQWRAPVIPPMFEAKPDHEILYLLALALNLAGDMFQGIGLTKAGPAIEDVTREANRGLRAIGYCGHSPERLKRQMELQHTFDRTTLQADGGPLDGEYYGLPWPCWGNPELGHPGTPNLFDTSKPVAAGGLCFPAIFGVEKDGRNLLAERSYPKDSDIKDGYPEFTMALLKQIDWDSELSDVERAEIEAIEGDETDWRTDLSGAIHRVALAHGCAPFGNGKARALLWDFPDPVPLHREPLYTSRRELVEPDKAKGGRVYLTYEDTSGFRLPLSFRRVQEIDYASDFPLVLVTGRFAEYDAGGDSTRANPWLAEIRQRMFIEINPRDANNVGLHDGDLVWVYGPGGGKVRAAAHVTRRVGPGVAFMPVHFAGQWMGESLRRKYPEDADAYVLGSPATSVIGYGYDPVAQMPETQCGLCRVEKA